MREQYLADENFPASIVKFLRTHGDDVLYAAESLIAASDEEVLREAATQSRVLLTFFVILANWCFVVGNSLLPALSCFVWGDNPQ